MGVPYDPPGEDSRKGAPIGTGSDGAMPRRAGHRLLARRKRWRRPRCTSGRHRTIVLGSVPHHFPIHVTSAERLIGRSCTGSTERTPRSPDGMSRQHPEGALRARSRRDLLDQCSAYACPMRAHARLPRRTASTCRSPRNRSSPATSRRERPAYACVRRIDKAPRKSPEKLGSSTRVPERTRW